MPHGIYYASQDIVCLTGYSMPHRIYYASQDALCLTGCTTPHKACFTGYTKSQHTT